MTIQVCRHFTKDYPDAYLVASTWKGTAPEDVAALEKVCIEVDLILDTPGLADDDRIAILGGTAARLLGLET